MNNGVAIKGVGAICALGKNIHEIGKAIFAPRRNIVSAGSLHPEAIDSPFFPALHGARANSAADTLALARIAAREAVNEAGWEDASDMAIIVGTTSGTALHFLESYRKQEYCQDAMDFKASNPALALGREYGASGPLLTISNACVSGTDAIGMGMQLIKSGMANRVLCGGADAFSLVAHTGFSRLMLYDKDLCRPFDKERKGLNLGEGAAFFCLERAKGNSCRFLLGYGAATDAWHLTAPHPEGKGLKMAIKDALFESNLDPHDLAFINAHATATRENDKIEGQTLASEMPDVPIWAAKGATGHTLGASGALETAFTLIALENGEIPPTPGFLSADPDTGITPASPGMKISKKAAMSVSMGFGGGNSVLILGIA